MQQQLIKEARVFYFKTKKKTTTIIIIKFLKILFGRNWTKKRMRKRERENKSTQNSKNEINFYLISVIKYLHEINLKKKIIWSIINFCWDMYEKLLKQLHNFLWYLKFQFLSIWILFVCL